MRVTFLLLLQVLLCPVLAADDRYDIGSRKITWIRPFEKAQAQAVKQSRLLIVKPVYRINNDRWYDSCQRLQVGPLSDPRVAGLIRRQFVANFFAHRAYGSSTKLLDPPGLAFCQKANAKLTFPGGSSSEPPLMVFDPSGKLLLQIHNDASPKLVLESLRAVLAAHPKYRQPVSSTATGRALMRHLIDTGQHVAAGQRIDEALSDKDDDPELLYLKGANHCRAGEWNKALYALDDLNISEQKGIDEYIIALQLDLAQRHRAAGKWVRFRKAMSVIQPRAAKIGRQQEATFYMALACHRCDQTTRAQSLWGSLAQSLPLAALMDDSRRSEKVSRWGLKAFRAKQDAQNNWRTRRSQFVDKKY